MTWPSLDASDRTLYMESPSSLTVSFIFLSQSSIFRIHALILIQTCSLMGTSSPASAGNEHVISSQQSSFITIKGIAKAWKKSEASLCCLVRCTTHVGKSSLLPMPVGREGAVESDDQGKAKQDHITYTTISEQMNASKRCCKPCKLTPTLPSCVLHENTKMLLRTCSHRWVGQLSIRRNIPGVCRKL